MGGLGIDFPLGNSRDVTGNLGTVGTVPRTLVPVDVLDVVLLLVCPGRKWGQCSALSLNHTTE